jgi:hypothetical protein
VTRAGIIAASWLVGLIGCVALACSSDAGIGVAGHGGGSGAPGAGGETGGSAGAGGNAGNAGASGNGATAGSAGNNGPRTCTRFPAGCSCVDGDPAADESPCTTMTVATMPGDVGVCCARTMCQCAPFICRNDASQGYCSCGVSTTITGVVQGDVVTTCPLPTAPQKCCYSHQFQSCVCSLLDCTTGWQTVPSCSITDVAVCLDGATSVAVCSTIDVGDGGMDGMDGGAGDADDSGADAP